MLRSEFSGVNTWNPCGLRAFHINSRYRISNTEKIINLKNAVVAKALNSASTTMPVVRWTRQRYESMMACPWCVWGLASRNEARVRVDDGLSTTLPEIEVFEHNLVLLRLRVYVQCRGYESHLLSDCHQRNLVGRVVRRRVCDLPDEQ